MILLARESPFHSRVTPQNPRIPQPLPGTDLPSLVPVQCPLLPCRDIQNTTHPTPAKPLSYWETLMSVLQQRQPPAWEVRDRDHLSPCGPSLSHFLPALFAHFPASSSAAPPAPHRSLAAGY